jgi:peptidoglycan/xylan/chitin deacetylase (PgdA/CDA1 family)
MNKYEDEIMIRALLTIDDVSSNNTPAIVDYLNGKNIPAIMFMVGQWAENYPAELIYALQHGMIVGNHSYTHPHFSEISFEECKKEIEKNEEVLNKFYEEAGVERKYRPFRFPYGDKGGDNKALIQEYLSQQGFDKVDDTKFGYPFWTEEGHNKDIDTYWTFDFAEYNIRPGSGFGLEDVMKRIYDKEPETGAPLLADGSCHLLLLHAHDETEAMVPEYYKIFIEELLKNGVEFVKPGFIS